MSVRGDAGRTRVEKGEGREKSKGKRSRERARERERREGREGIGAGRVAQRMAIVGGWDGPRGWWRRVDAAESEYRDISIG